MCYLKSIEIQKRLFVLELEQGKEVAIPYYLTQSHLPSSFRFYDMIINIAQDYCSKDKRNILSLQMQLSKYYQDQYSMKSMCRDAFCQKSKSIQQLLRDQMDGNKESPGKELSQNVISYTDSLHSKKI